MAKCGLHFYVLPPLYRQSNTIRVSPLQDSCNEAHSPDHTGAGLVVTETSPEAEAEEEAGKVDIMANLFEKLFNLNKKLEEQEDDIFRY